ncbi:nuclease-related domain-containing protein [Salimicrobium halophilum]|uniref:nuclease-related domain-containing protein n=1 Tax=Salimicrobium halophilum TaxID=86666 RepID=UPI0015A11F20|nr:nuclease-related domain-containing protein [Salimicrobium halophilum]
MLKKQVMKPVFLEKLEALSRRLSDASPKKPFIEDTLNRHQAGFVGEKSLLFQFSYLPTDWLIFHDLRLHDGTHYFQIDFLIITNDSLLLLEVKNLAGRLIFDGTRQLIQERENGTRGADSPIAQTARHERQLERWLTLHDFPHLPLTSLIVLANANSYFETDHPGVLRASMLPEHLPEETGPPMPTSIRTSLMEKLLHSHQPGQPYREIRYRS